MTTIVVSEKSGGLYDDYLAGCSREDWLLAYSYEDYLHDWKALFGYAAKGARWWTDDDDGEERLMQVDWLSEWAFYDLKARLALCDEECEQLEMEMQLLM